MIQINDKLLASLSDVSERFRKILSLIRDGVSWMKWAIADKLHSAVNVAGEEQLILAIQHGLHAEDCIRFNTFRASIRKILTLPDKDIDFLTTVNRTVGDNDLNLRNLLQQNGLLSYTAIAKGAALAGRLAETQPDLFQALSFSDQLALAAFIQRDSAVNNDDLRKRSYAFTHDRAETVSDFINVASFYRTVSQSVGANNLVLMMTEDTVSRVYDLLLAESVGLLYTPNAGPARGERALREKIPELLKTSRMIGYHTMSACVYNLSQNLPVHTLITDPQQLRPLIETYLAAVKNLVAASRTAEYSVSQDGRTDILQFRHNASVARIGMDTAGSVFILPDTKIQ